LTISPQTTEIDLGSTPAFTLTLQDSQGHAMPEKTIITILQGENGTKAFKNATNYLGQVILDLDGLPIGAYSVDAYFSGTFTYAGRTYSLDDPTYEPSSASASIFPALKPIQATLEPTMVGSTFEASALLAGSDDPGSYSAEWDWGDETDSSGELSSDGENILVSGSHEYTTAGVYTVKLTVSHGEVPFQEAEFQYVVVYDPSEGFVTGGGWIDSPAGAYAADPTLTGKATFGFVSKYKKGANVPTGNTEFHFNVADLKFRSTEYQWLVIAGPKAKFKGTGTINGSGNYGFMITAVDADLTPSTDVDLFRIKIWDIDNGNVIVYDNQMGEPDDSDLATAIGGGSIKIHKK
jgi:PKD repeat protein